MRSILLAIATTLCGSAIAQTTPVKTDATVKTQYPYVSIGVGPLPLPLPVFGVGYRYQRNHHGFDTSFDVATVGEVTGLKGSALYTYYFKPKPASQIYFGVGPSIGGFIAHHPKFGGALEGKFGKQYINENLESRFFELSIDFPIITGGKHPVHYFPVTILKYGIGF